MVVFLHFYTGKLTENKMKKNKNGWCFDTFSTLIHENWRMGGREFLRTENVDRFTSSPKKP